VSGPKLAPDKWYLGKTRGGGTLGGRKEEGWLAYYFDQLAEKQGSFFFFSRNICLGVRNLYLHQMVE
jgi:hypothetical protein